MTKSTITKTWIAGLIVLVAGLIVGGISLGLMLTNGGHWTQVPGTNSWNFNPRTDSYFWTTLGWTIAGFTIVLAGGIVQLVAWIGAVANTSGMQDRTWFLILLIGGLIGFGFAPVGFAVMVAYLAAGPDGTALRQPASPLHSGPSYPPYSPYPPYPPYPPTPASEPKTLVPTT